MILHGSRFIFESDIGRPTRHTNDPSIDLQGIVRLLLQRPWPGTEAEQGSRASIARKAQAELSAARVSDAETKKLQLELASARDTINHLLAFVPNRAPALSRERRREVVSGLAAAARNLHIPGLTISFEWSEASDEDTSACHRLVVFIQVCSSLEPVEAAAVDEQLHDSLFDILADSERTAFQLIVNYGPA